MYILPVLLVMGCQKEGCKDEVAFNYDNDPKVTNNSKLCEYSLGFKDALTKRIVVGSIMQGESITWSKIPGADIDYLVSTLIIIDGSLNIEPGVVVQFTQNGGFAVRNHGQLLIEGTTSENVILENDGSTQRWHGVSIRPVGISSASGRKLTLHNVIIRNASNYDYDCAIYVENYCDLDFKNLEINGGTDYGLYIADMGFTSVMNNVTIKGFVTPFYSYEWKIIGDLDQFTLIDNDNNWFDFRINYITTSVLKPFNNKQPVYFSNGGYITFTDLFVQAGAEFVMPISTTLNVTGEISCQGTLNNPITFRGDGNSTGWLGLKIKMINNIQCNYTKIQGVYGGAGIQVDYDSSGFLSYTNGQVQGVQGGNVSCGISFSGIATVPSNKYDISGTIFGNLGFNICP